ncbi:MAG: hypothetical protein IPP97_11030 [Candidatus Obscuribacter sp.]|nr:hypothetical protein [Candidatus Obscuribacter sp.]
MQPGFEAARDISTIFAVSKQIEMAMALNLTIILVEYDAHEMGQRCQKLRGFSKATSIFSVASKQFVLIIKR